jgi:hypothetical protein
MTTYAAAIAARLQGREDEDMGKDEARRDAWADVALRIENALADAAGRIEVEVAELRKTVEGAPSAEDGSRVAELERDLADAKYNAESFREQAENAGKAHRQALDQIDELERELEAARELVVRNSQACDELLATAYVAREVPWTDVAAGMMTIARDGTPWMVEHWTGAPCDPIVLRNGEKTFEKTPAEGETVRVLVPYVTPEQAEGLVASELGGTEVGS